MDSDAGILLADLPAMLREGDALHRDMEGIGMTDLEITRACAEAMGYTAITQREESKKLDLSAAVVVAELTTIYRPLHDDAQCFALVKRFRLEVYCEPEHDNLWLCNEHHGEASMHADLNRAICLCVSKMHRREA